MLERVEHENGVVTYRSAVLSACGVVHGFSTRIGGISRGVYASLNLGPLRKEGGDPNTNISENFRRLRKALGAERLMRLEARQVHGAEVYVDDQEKVVRLADAPRADAIMTDRADKLVTIRTADCVPVLISSDDGAVVAGIHSGWRGFVAGECGVIRACVARMVDAFGLDVKRLCAAVGPSISVAHYEVGEEVVAAFEAAGRGELVRRDVGVKAHLDLKAGALGDLLAAGLERERIDTTELCTFTLEDAFYSYRRDRGKNGQMASVIAPVADRAS